MQGQWDHKIFSVTDESFDQLALEIFQFQYDNNTVYRDFANAVGKTPDRVSVIDEIPFLPVRFFKTHKVVTTYFEPATVFESSGTSGMIKSRHFIKDLNLYEQSFTQSFEMFYGPVADWCIIGLLPSYLEKGNSSLVYMTDRLIKKSLHPESGFYLYDFEKLIDRLNGLEKSRQKTLLLGVTFALLDLAGKFSMPLKYTTIMETGGMKGRRKEIIREDVHNQLKKAFSIKTVHSEYGMTELMSQAWSKGEGVFKCPYWMKIVVRDEEDPFTIRRHGSGTINVIDLANIWSCSFIATDDAGIVDPSGNFFVLGRIDGSDLRGCSLLTV